MTTQDRNVYRTTDMSLVAFLQMHDCHSLECSMKGPRGPAAWLFERSARLTELVSQYTNRQALVEPREFTTTLSSVRNEMYQLRDQQNGGSGRSDRR